MATQGVNFDFTSSGADRLAADFRKTGDNAVLAGKGARLCADALEKQRRAADVSAGATLALAKADSILEEAEHGLRDGALEAEFALKQQAEAEKKAARAALEAEAANKRQASSLQKLADSAKKSSGPLWLGPAVALLPAAGTLAGVAAGAVAGLGGAFIAGAGALAAFGVVAKPVLTDAKTAAGAVEKAQAAYNIAIAGGTKQSVAYKAEQAAIAKAYAGMSPAQIALSKQLGTMADAWDKVKAAQTPVVAGALQPWLKSITDLTGKLGPVIAKIAPVIGGLGTQFGALVNSSAFTKFRDFIGSTGAAAVSAGGSTIIDLVKSFMILLPKFDPLIREAVGWISRLGPAVLTWASSKKASDQITAFLQWFSQNGHVVGDLIKNIGGALKALAPGLASGGAAEIKVISDFLGLVAKLPPSVAKPLAEVAGAALILSKMGVLKVGLQVVGPALKWLSGGLVNIGGGATAAGAMRAAFETGGTSAAAKMVAALETGGATAAGEEGVALAGAGAGAGKAASGSFLTALAAAPGLPLIGGIIAGALIKAAGDRLAPKGSVAGAASAGFQRTGAPGATITGGWVGALAQALGIGVTRAAASVGAATAKITADFARQGKAATTAMGDVGTLTNAITHNGNASGEAHNARAALITDMVKAGVNAATAQADVVRYSNAVTANGATSDQARGARQRLITDILNASANSRKGNTDLSAYTTAVQAHGTKSDAARGARQRLITDLVNSGTDARTATGLVDGLGTSIKNLPAGKTITITEKGLGKFAVSQTMTAANNPAFGISGRKAAGGLIWAGTGPTADDVPIMASRGELVVPAHMVKAGAVDHLRGRLPGFAAGGVVPSYSGSIGGLGPWTTRNDAAFTDTMTAAMEKAMTAATKAAMAAAVGGGPNGPGGAASSPQIIAWINAALSATGTSGTWLLGMAKLVQRESGGNPLAANRTAAGIAAGGPEGIAQTIPTTFRAHALPGHGNIWNPVDNLIASIRYIKATYGSVYNIPGILGGAYVGYARGGRIPGFAQGGLIPGYATGGTVAQQGQRYLNAWRSRRGTGAHGPAGVNEQIAAMRAAIGRAQVLSRARGLSASQHRFWAGAAAGEGRQLAGLNREAGVERAWRGQLGTADATLTREIAAARNLPSLAGPVRSWKAQLAAHQYTIGQINRMLTAAGPAKAAGEPAGLTALQISREGQTYLNAWRSRAGGGFGAAHGPQTLNQQIPAMQAAIGRAATLSRAPGLSAGQHKFWANAAADETRRLAVLRKEMTVEQGWRGQLAALNAGLARDITAAGGLPSLAGSVKSWKAQQAAHTYTIGQISGMVGLTAAQQATANLPKITHTYGGDVANTIGTVLSAALGPFTGAARGGLIMDSGGWLKPGWNPPVYNGTGRPEQVLPARSGAGGRLQVEWVGGNGGDDLERWIRKNVRIRGGTGPGAVDRAYGSR